MFAKQENLNKVKSVHFQITSLLKVWKNKKHGREHKATDHVSADGCDGVVEHGVSQVGRYVFFSHHLDMLHKVFVKLADMQTAENSAGETEGSGVFFNHPFLQVQSHLLFLSATFDRQAASMFLRGMLDIITFI